MSELDNALMHHMRYLVFIEKRPFCYRDFLRFEIDGKAYRMKHGTFRNHVSKLMKAGKVERKYHSGLCFYTIKGVNFGRRKSKPLVETTMMMQPMTSNHMEVSHCHCHCHYHHPSPNNENVVNDPIITYSTHPIDNIIENLPLDKNSLHDIHMRFDVPNIWTLVSSSVDAVRSRQQQEQQEQQQLRLNSVSKDIALPTWKIKDLDIKVIVHRTNTVSVVIGCSYAPIALDINGVIRLSNALTRVEERLSRLVQDCSSKVISGDEYESLSIPEHTQWVVTMWHFGADASVEYTGEKFSATWGVGENALIRTYSKVMTDSKTRIRLERQEYPNKSLADAVMDKLSPSSSSS